MLSEDSLRKNFVLVYELLDEMVDFGCDLCPARRDAELSTHHLPPPHRMERLNAVRTPLRRAPGMGRARRRRR